MKKIVLKEKINLLEVLEVREIKSEIKSLNKRLKKIKESIVNDIVNQMIAKIDDARLIELLLLKDSHLDPGATEPSKPLLATLISKGLRLSARTNFYFKHCSHDVAKTDVLKIYPSYELLEEAINKLNQIIFNGREVVRFYGDFGSHNRLVVRFVFREA